MFLNHAPSLIQPTARALRVWPNTECLFCIARRILNFSWCRSRRRTFSMSFMYLHIRHAYIPHLQLCARSIGNNCRECWSPLNFWLSKNFRNILSENFRLRMQRRYSERAWQRLVTTSTVIVTVYDKLLKEKIEEEECSVIMGLKNWFPFG